jgi:outer membrane protein assembly factor BamB
MKRLSIALIIFGLVFLTSCKLQKQGLVIMTDSSYKASIFATNKTGIGSPDGLVWRGNTLYLADEGSDALEVWSQAGGLKRLADAKLGCLSPEDLVIDKDGNIGEQHEVFRVTRDGKVSEFLGKEFGITKPESMVFDDKGNLYIADNEDNILYLLDANHTLHRLIERRDSFSPETIFYSKGSLYITDSKDGKLYVYNPSEELKTIAAFGGQLKNVQGITVDDGGNIYLTVQTDLKHNAGDIIEISKESSAIAQR